jgi:predicted transglutaminase-like cysteine proteinase
MEENMWLCRLTKALHCDEFVLSKREKLRQRGAEGETIPIVKPKEN